MTDTLRERIAIALFQHDYPKDDWRRLDAGRGSYNQDRYREKADVVMEAIYDPTDHMVDEAGGEYVNLERADDPTYQPRLVWQDMVDTARKEPR